MGSQVGTDVAARLGAADFGLAVGWDEGAGLDSDGACDGRDVSIGMSVGAQVGVGVGETVLRVPAQGKLVPKPHADGGHDGCWEGISVEGIAVGLRDGMYDGCTVEGAIEVGVGEGSSEGIALLGRGEGAGLRASGRGRVVGNIEGATVGDMLGEREGSVAGRRLGAVDGAVVGLRLVG